MPFVRSRQRAPGDRGETLVEVLVALTILGVAGVAILVGFQLLIKTSDFQRKQSTSSVYLRSVAEAIQTHVAAGNYVPCAGAQLYRNAIDLSKLKLPTTRGVTYSVNQLAAESWGVVSGVAKWKSPCAGDAGVQRVLLKVVSSGNATHPVSSESLYVVLRRPCAGAVGSPC